jgi:hypothetical protein
MTGSWAVNFYGIPRATHDIDLVVQMDLADADSLARAFPSEYYFDVSMIRDAIRRQFTFNVIDPESGLKIDF